MKTHSHIAALLVAFALLIGSSPTANADTFKVDPVHSFALFSIHHFNAGNVWGRFNEPAGDFTLDPADPSKDVFHVQLKVASLDTGNTKRDSDLQGPDWFNVRQYSTISFKSTSVKKGEGNTLEVTGDLTLRGMTKPIVVAVELTGTAKDPFGNTRGGIQGTATIKRSEFGMTAMGGAVGDEVRLIVALEGIKQ